MVQMSIQTNISLKNLCEHSIRKYDFADQAIIFMEASNVSLEIFKQLSNIFSTLDHVDKIKKGVFKKAIIFEDFRLMQNLMKIDFDIHQSYEFDVKSIHYASAKNKVNSINFLLQNGADINAVDFINRTPLHIAAMNVNLEAVEFLLKKNANVDVKDLLNNTVLHYLFKAALNFPKDLDRITEITILLISNKIKTDVVNSVEKETAINLAVKYKLYNTLEAILKLKKSIIDECNGDGETPLFIAAMENDIQSFKMLLQYGANPYVKSKNQVSAFDFIKTD